MVAGDAGDARERGVSTPFSLRIALLICDFLRAIIHMPPPFAGMGADGISGKPVLSLTQRTTQGTRARIEKRPLT